MTNVFGTNNSQISWKEKGPIGLFTTGSKVQKIIFAGFGGTIILVLLVASITGQQTPIISTTSTGESLPGKGVNIESVHSSLLEERFQTEIINIGLRKLGYKTSEPKQIEPTTFHLALGQGDLDYTAVHWEKGHKSFFEKGGGEEKLEKVGVLTPNLLNGYQIDKKTAEKYNITNLAQLKDPKIAKIFDSDGDGKANLTGCNSGWGCQIVISHHLKAYGLENTVEQDQGSYSALIANTITRYKQGKPVLYYTWTPYWMSVVLKPGKDVTWLEVPFTSLPKELGEFTEKDTSADGKNLGFAIDRMRVVANKEFLADNPAAKRLFELVEIPVEDINAQNELLKEGENRVADIRRHAQEWITNNQEKFDGWVEEAISAAL
jgi:glycine betaine/proline transport system substrate-binding protein